uniref:Uncharacterized protein n=1 Tax=Hyaloperonospora arabidopsidis (strain Emoy2) TaxID=559515 RepID=M4B582_HYAAE
MFPWNIRQSVARDSHELLSGGDPSAALSKRGWIGHDPHHEQSGEISMIKDTIHDPAPVPFTFHQGKKSEDYRRNATRGTETSEVGAELELVACEASSRCRSTDDVHHNDASQARRPP